MISLSTLFNRAYGDSLQKTVAFDGGTVNAAGDYDGTGNPIPLFRVQGTVLVRIGVKCTENLAGASATLKVGTSVSDANLIASTTATDIDNTEIWHDASPDASAELESVLTWKVVSHDIIMTAGVANITDGTLVCDLQWKPFSSNGRVTVA